jgi:hypothetical protein
VSGKAWRIMEMKRWVGDAALYRVEPPHEGHEYVVVSAVVVPCSGPETYIFGCDSLGKASDFSALGGSFRGQLDHVAALSNAGYEVLPS